MSNLGFDLEAFAATYQHDNHAKGDPGYCEAQLASWTLEWIDPCSCAGFSGADDARAWLDEEIAGAVGEGRGDVWACLLSQEIKEPVVVLQRDGVLYIWDGYHRVAASLVKGALVLAVIGRPAAA